MHHTHTTISSSTQNKILRQLLSFKNAYPNSPSEAMVGTVEKLNLQRTFVDFLPHLHTNTLSSVNNTQVNHVL